MISYSSAHGELTVVQDVRGIEPAFSAMVEEPLPGFQIAPEVDKGAALLFLAGLVREYDPSFEFNSFTERTSLHAIERPHLDGGYVADVAGVALHEVVAGEGTVALQLVQPGVSVNRNIDPSVFVGPCLRGRLVPGMKTVFSQGLYVPGKGVILGGTYHSFVTAGDGLRTWRRYTSQGHPDF